MKNLAQVYGRMNEIFSSKIVSSAQDMKSKYFLKIKDSYHINFKTNFTKSIKFIEDMSEVIFYNITPKFSTEQNILFETSVEKDRNKLPFYVAQRTVKIV